MTPLTTLADATDIYTARTVMETLRKAGYIIVRKDAIERAQREAVAAFREDSGEHESAVYIARKLAAA